MNQNVTQPRLKISIGRQAEAAIEYKPIDNPRASSQAEGQQP
jgi:hypothetical protein